MRPRTLHVRDQALTKFTMLYPLAELVLALAHRRAGGQFIAGPVRIPGLRDMRTWPDFMNQFRRYLTHESRDLLIALATMQGARFSITHYQFMPCPGDTDIAKPTLFLELTRNQLPETGSPPAGDPE